MANYPYTVPGEQAFMGKGRTYSAQTQFRQHAVRLRALKDNPRNPSIVGAIGPNGDWAVDDPSAIVEEGSNSNGSYKIFADSWVKQYSGLLNFTRHGYGHSSAGWQYPISLINSPYAVIASAITHVGGGSGDAVATFTQLVAKDSCWLASRMFLTGGGDSYVSKGTGSCEGYLGV